MYFSLDLIGRMVKTLQLIKKSTSSTMRERKLGELGANVVSTLYNTSKVAPKPDSINKDYKGIKNLVKQELNLISYFENY